jgi:O-methyltransferase
MSVMTSSLKGVLKATGFEPSARRLHRWWKLRGSVVPLLRHPPFGEPMRYDVARSRDPVRYASIALALHRIDAEGIAGQMAEVGVYRGATSRFLHAGCPRRKLYLFDTFEGFPEVDLEVSEDDRFRGTSVELVKSVIGDLNNVEFREGYFPETAAGLESETFAFAMLDVDLYKPTLAALQFFYPRMSRGGYIFLHDYTSPESDQGVSRAAREFLADKPEQVIELPDRDGSALFRKM